MFAWKGKLLRIDLSRQNCSVEEIPPDLLREYIGGRGAGLRLVFDEMDPGIDPLGPENKLIFATGPLVGTGVPAGDDRTPVRGAGSPLPESGAPSPLRANMLRVGALAAAALAVLLLATLVQFLAIFLGAGAAPLIATAAALVVVLTVPVIDLLGRPNRIWLPAAAALVAVGLVAYGSLNAGA